ncbi:hypothetical protein ACFLRI_01255 [Bacteroidota bacterium]
MENIIPRYEYRFFTTDKSLIMSLKSRVEITQIRDSYETYILQHLNSEINCKIRHNTLDVKVFLEELNGNELWTPKIKAEFPIAVSIIRNELSTYLPVDCKETKSALSQDELFELCIRPGPHLKYVEIHKERMGFMNFDCIGEIATITTNGQQHTTFALESEDTNAIWKARKSLGIDNIANENYIRALKRIYNFK